MEGNEDLIRLVKSFEEKNQSGTILYLDENEAQRLISYYEKSDMIDKAINVVDMALEVNKFREEHYILKARLLRKEGRFYDALETLELSSLFTPNSIDNVILTIKIYLDLKAVEKAQDLLESRWEEIKLHSYISALLLKAKMYESRRDYEGMYPVVRTAVLHNHNSSIALEKFWIAVELTNNYEDSIEIHKDIIDNSPYNYQAWYNIGHAYACIGEYDKAIMALEYSYIINEDFEVGYFDCADVCFQVKKFDKSLVIYLEALKKFGPECELLTRIGECYIKLSNFTVAESHLRKAIKLDPYNDEAYYHLSLCYIQDKLYTKALKAIHKAIQLEDRREEYYSTAAEAYMQVDDYIKADYYHRKATETGPEDNLYWESHVAFLFKLGLYEEVLDVVNQSEEHTYSELLIAYKVSCLFRTNNQLNAYEELKEIVVDNNEFSHTLFSIDNELQSNKIAIDMIKLVTAEAK